MANWLSPHVGKEESSMIWTYNEPIGEMIQNNCAVLATEAPSFCNKQKAL